MSEPFPESILEDQNLAKKLVALGNSHRRSILLGLKEGQLSSIDGAILRSGQEEIRRELEHEHLPMLQEAGFIEWDRETGEITPGPKFEDIRPILKLIQEHPEELPSDWV